MEESKKRRREGEVLKGKYRLDRHIATGGMGEVYEAANLALGRTVAVKLLLDEFISDEDNVQRFLLEARTASMVQHPNIVQVFDVDKTESGVPFIVQEFLRGETLSQRLRRTRESMSSKHVLDILIPVIEAIGQAHKAGIVHRDIKPSNIFLTASEHGLTGKILDFGISRVASAAEDVRLTKTTAVLGSPAYMSPEQIQSARNATTRSDVWSIGVMMYELLSGELPFKGKTSSEIMVNVCTRDPVSLQESAPGISPVLAEVVERCMSRKPSDRYLDGESLAEALREVREQEFSARQPDSATTPPHGAPAVQARETDAAPSRHGAAESLSVDTPSVSFDRNAAAATGRNESAGGGGAGNSADRHASYGDIPAIAAAFAILIGVTLLNAVFAPAVGPFAEPGETTLATMIVQLLVAGGVLYVAQITQSRASQYSGKGATIAVFGLYGVAASLVLLAGAGFLHENSIMPLLGTLLSVSIALVSFGLAVVGFEYVYEQVMVEQLITLPGATAAAFSLIAVVVGVRFLYRVVG